MGTHPIFESDFDCLTAAEAPKGCSNFNNDFNTGHLMWSADSPKYSVQCGMGDGTFLDWSSIGEKAISLHPISTNIRNNDGANSCVIKCNPGTIGQYPGKYPPGGAVHRMWR